MAKHDFKPGETLRVKAAFYRVRHPRKVMVMRGQTMEVTEADLQRPDAHVIWERLEPGDSPMPHPKMSDAAAEGIPDVRIDTPEPGALHNILDGMIVKEAKEFLSGENWDVETLEIARGVEANGKNRAGIIEYIDGRIAQIKDEVNDAHEDDDEEDDED